VLFTGGGIPAGETGGTNGLVEQSLRHAAFQTVSIVTTTGYASLDFNAWAPPAKALLLVAMFIGGSAGSTGGGIKVVRWLIVLKSVRRELFSTVHPDAIKPVRLGGRALDERAIRGIHAFTLLYLAIFFVGVAAVSADAARVNLVVGGQPLSVLEAVAATAATLGNIGPGFGLVGPMNNYLFFPPTSKLLMVFLMWAGRLEIIPVFVLLTRAFWRT
jgi:trk system potassium uptake protein TrkH